MRKANVAISILGLGLALLLARAPVAGADTYTYTYNAADQLATVQGPNGAASYTYDGDGQRITRSTAAGQTIYVRDPQGEVIAEYSSTGQLLAEYVYVDGQRLCKITHDGQGVEHRVYYHQDVVGTPVAETNESGQVLVRAQYYPFGEEVIPGAAPDPHKFTGKELDDESGLYYFGARYYDAHLGRFVSTESTAGSNFDPQSWNRYAYSRNNPLNRIDPNGKAWIQVNVTGVDAMRNMIQQTLAPVLGSKVSTALASALVPAQFDPAMCALGMASPLVVTTPALSRGAQILANAAQGRAAEALASEQLENAGNSILGSQVSANTSLGRRVIDHLIRTPEGKILAVEVKSGGGTRTAAQLAKDTEMAITGATLVGKYAPDELQGVQVIETVLMRIIF